jgi:RNA polymerase sigma-70 factor (ECF subfamily)
MDISDKVILNELKKRNKRVFETLFYEYHPKLLRYVDRIVFNRDVSEDIVQSIFVTLWEKIDSIQIHTSFQSYLFQSVRYKAFAYLKHLNVEDNYKLLYWENKVLENTDKDVSTDSELSQIIQNAVATLPPEMGKIFQAKYSAGMQTKDIALAFDISENTVKTHLKRAKKQLRYQLSRASFIHFYL